MSVVLVECHKMIYASQHPKTFKRGLSAGNSKWNKTEASTSSSSNALAATSPRSGKASELLWPLSLWSTTSNLLLTASRVPKGWVCRCETAWEAWHRQKLETTTVCWCFGLGLLCAREVWKRFSRSNFVCQSFTCLTADIFSRVPVSPTVEISSICGWWARKASGFVHIWMNELKWYSVRVLLWWDVHILLCRI